MRLYMSVQEQKELKNLLAQMKNQLAMLPEGDLATEDDLENRKDLELMMAGISSSLLSPILPVGLLRQFACLLLIGLTIAAFYTPYEWLLWCFIPAVFTSPFLTGCVAYLAGVASRKK